jgi:hypothetical protein
MRRVIAEEHYTPSRVQTMEKCVGEKSKIEDGSECSEKIDTRPARKHTGCWISLLFEHEYYIRYMNKTPFDEGEYNI